MKIKIQKIQKHGISIPQLKRGIEEIIMFETGPQRRASLRVLLEAVEPYVSNDPQAANDLRRVKALGTAAVGADFTVDEIVDRLERLVRRIPGLAIEITA